MKPSKDAKTEVQWSGQAMATKKIIAIILAQVVTIHLIIAGVILSS